MRCVGVLNWRNINSKFSENRWTGLKVEMGSTVTSTHARTKHTHNVNSKFSENRWTGLKVEIGNTVTSTHARTKHTHTRATLIRSLVKIGGLV